MELVETVLNDLLIIQPKVFNDSRGYFFESFNEQRLRSIGIESDFVQDNESYSEYGTIRGIHFQLAPYSQAKLVRVVHGRILDVALDIRKNSPTYGKFFTIELDSETKRILFIPKGFAHGFSVLSANALVNYKCDALHNSQAERGINYNDPFLGIDWKVEPDKAKVSSKDKVLPFFNQIESNFIFGKHH
jgi:dTDP-4-dehydrorhamnose 3,5-epimerase